MKQDNYVKAVAEPDGLQNPLYQLVRKAVIAADLRRSLIGTKNEVLAKGMHHCYAMQYFIPGCKPAFDEIIRLIKDYFHLHRRKQ